MSYRLAQARPASRASVAGPCSCVEHTRKVADTLGTGSVTRRKPSPVLGRAGPAQSQIEHGPAGVLRSMCHVVVQAAWRAALGCAPVLRPDRDERCLVGAIVIDVDLYWFASGYGIHMHGSTAAVTSGAT